MYHVSIFISLIWGKSLRLGFELVKFGRVFNWLLDAIESKYLVNRFFLSCWNIFVDVKAGVYTEETLKALNSPAEEITELNKNFRLSLTLLKMLTMLYRSRYCHLSDKWREMSNILKESVLRSRKYLPQLTIKN